MSRAFGDMQTAMEQGHMVREEIEENKAIWIGLRRRIIELLYARFREFPYAPVRMVRPPLP